MNPLRSYERLMELLADRALEGLNAEQEAELERLLLWHPEVDPLSLDLAAAAVARSSPELAKPAPPGLLDRIERQARGEAAPAPTVSPPGPRPRRLPTAVAWSGWVAAAVLLVITLPWRPAAASPAELRQRLLAVEGTMLIPAAPGTEPAAGGDVVWHGGKQEGYLRLVGLPANDPRRLQYQLWIFDAGRDDRFPVDGGVFDVPSGRNVVVPIRAKLPVGRPTLFAVTSEAPGGVVVSDRKRIVVAAKVP